MTMIRLEEVDFVYTDLGVGNHVRRYQKGVRLEVRGVVYGLLTVENELDTENLESLLAVSQGLEK